MLCCFKKNALKKPCTCNVVHFHNFPHLHNPHFPHGSQLPPLSPLHTSLATSPTSSSYPRHSTIPYHILPYQTISYHIIPYHTTSYHTNSYQVLPYHLQLPPLHTSFATSPNVISRRSLLHFKLRVDLVNASISKYSHSQSKLSQK